MNQGTVTALIIGGLGILCALGAWQRPRLERAVDWALTPLVWLVGWVQTRRRSRVKLQPLAPRTFAEPAGK